MDCCRRHSCTTSNLVPYLKTSSWHLPIWPGVQTPSTEASANDVPDSEEAEVKSSEGASKQEVEAMTEPAVLGEQQSISANAPAWMPVGDATDVASRIALTRDDQAHNTSGASEIAATEAKRQDEVGESDSLTAPERAAPEKGRGGEKGGSSNETVEPKVPDDELNP